MKITLDLPEGYEYTGEHRQATSGDTFLNSQNEMHVITSTSTHGHYPILKKKAPKYKTYSFGSCTECSTGESYEFVEIKALEDAIRLSYIKPCNMTDAQCDEWNAIMNLLN